MRFVLGLLLCVTLLGGAATAQETDVLPPPGLELEVQLGFEGAARPWRWCPVEVVLRHVAGRPLRGVLTLERWPAFPTPQRQVHDAVGVELLPGAVQRLRLAVRTDEDAGLRLVLRDADGALVFRRLFHYRAGDDALLRLDSGVPLFATLRIRAEDRRIHWPRGLAQRFVPDEARARERPQAVLIGPELPEARALSGLDALLLPGPPGLDAAGAETLAAFVEEGGLLIAASGTRAAAWGDEPLGALLPVTIAGQANHADGLASIDSSRPVGEVTPLALGHLRPGAEVLRRHGSLPLVTRRAYGKGQVAFLAFPLDCPGFSDDAARTRVLSEAVHLPAFDPEGQRLGDPLENELSGVLGEQALGEVSFVWILVLVFGFLVVVGPVDYLIWRLVPRPQVTWLLLLVTSLGFSALAFLLGHVGRGEALVVAGTVLVDRGAPVAEGASPSAPRPVVMEGLLSLAARRLEWHALELPEGLRLAPARGELELPSAHDVLGHELRVRLGIAQAVPFRFTGRVDLPWPLYARWDSDGQLMLENLGERSLQVSIVQQGARFRVHTLSPGQTRVWTPEPLAVEDELDPILESQFQEGGWGDESPPAEYVRKALLRVCLAKLATESHGEFPSLPRSMKNWTSLAQWGLANQPERIDLTPAYRRGAVLVIAVAEGLPLALHTRGRPLEAPGATAYRLILDPP